MPSLPEYQREFLAALRGAQPLPPGLAAYRLNLHENFRHALALAYPVIAQLCGEAHFAHVALEFQRAHPSRSGDLHHAGAPFAEWLSQRYERTPHEYFGSVATLEAGVQQVLRVAAAPALGAQQLSAVETDSLDDLVLQLHPTARFLRLAHPAGSIWLAHQPGGDVGLCDPLGGPECAVVSRGPRGVEVQVLDAGLAVFVESISQGASLGVALDAAQMAEGAFEVAGGLSRALEHRWFAALGTPS